MKKIIYAAIILAFLFLTLPYLQEALSDAADAARPQASQAQPDRTVKPTTTKGKS